MVASEDPGGPVARKSGASVGETPAAGEAPRRSPKPAAKLLEARSARHESLEQQHLAACGKQVSSVRPTMPAPKFASPRVLSDGGNGRCRELTEHPSLENPAPAAAIPLEDCTRTQVLKGFGQDRRFMDDGPDTKNGAVCIAHSTNASPFSPTYPWQGGDKKVSLPDAQDLRRRHPQAVADFNCLHHKYASKPSWSFGSAGLGERFQTGGWRTSKKQALPSGRSRLREFNELREKMILSPRSPRVSAAP